MELNVEMLERIALLYDTDKVFSQNDSMWNLAFSVDSDNIKKNYSDKHGNVNACWWFYKVLCLEDYEIWFLFNMQYIWRNIDLTHRGLSRRILFLANKNNIEKFESLFTKEEFLLIKNNYRLMNEKKYLTIDEIKIIIEKL